MANQSAVKTHIPDHVPAKLVWPHSFDSFTAEGNDPFRAAARLHDGPGIVWTSDASYGRPGWIVTQYDLNSDVLLDHERFSAEREGMVADLREENVRLNPIEIDPPAHHGYRRNLNPQFTPRAVNGLEAAVRATCAKLIAGFKAPDGCEFISEFAVAFPTNIFLNLMAVSRERAGDFLAWEDALMRAPDPMERVKAAREIYEYLKEHKTRQQSEPGNDLNRTIVGGEFDGRSLNHLEMMGMYYVLRVGGLDTVYSTCGWIMRRLATNPEQQQRLRENPDDVPAAIEEFTRAFSVVVTHREVARTARSTACRCARARRSTCRSRWPIATRPNAPTRTSSISTASRATSPSASGCTPVLASISPSASSRIAIEEFLTRFRDIRIRGGEEYRYHSGRTFGIEYLPLVWEPA